MNEQHTDNPIKISREELVTICSSQKWVRSMLLSAPFASFSDFMDNADKAFSHLLQEDWLEAFAGHPMIGDLSTLEKKYEQSKSLSAAEQSQVSVATKETLQELLELNQAYYKKFGFIFIVCATNKSASEMLDILRERISNQRDLELLNASAEQRKISKIRMEAYL